ncbi:hypothetical protein [Reinekea blandensis]|uniref:Uncharacterized protein n=1 Tax=Reinekea blandensis MED297 TaxID=314283 RepID=A4BGS2_9GAMM|nr:hypothetical protein [Reinekea blandensis]EAR08720.1 hypothetical protein MED297_14430 [Reinekea sp. MED297] [Reinekea blandensis MED297]
MPLNILLKPHVSALFAFIGYGSWAALSNSSFGWSTSMVALMIQGSFAFTSTLLLGRFTLQLSHRLGTSRRAQTTVWLISLTLLVSIPLSLHLLAGTPNTLRTMLPGLLIGNLYVFGLLRTASISVTTQ